MAEANLSESENGFNKLISDINTLNKITISDVGILKIFSERVETLKTLFRDFMNVENEITGILKKYSCKKYGTDTQGQNGANINEGIRIKKHIEKIHALQENSEKFKKILSDFDNFVSNKIVGLNENLSKNLDEVHEKLGKLENLQKYYEKIDKVEASYDYQKNYLIKSFRSVINCMFSSLDSKCADIDKKLKIFYQKNVKFQTK